MPIYEYQCGGCEHKLETIQKMNEDPLKLCPECGEKTLRKLISAVSFRLKGTGWYETDFKDKLKDGNNKNNNIKNKDAKEASKDKKDSSIKSDKSEKKETATKSSSSSETKATSSSD